MDSLTALEFNGNILGPSIVAGITTSGLYGLVAVALVLSYRISRTIAFVHGGIVLSGALLFWYFCTPSYEGGSELLAGESGGGGRPDLPMWPPVARSLPSTAGSSPAPGWPRTRARR
jgi:hypothetical protein